MCVCYNKYTFNNSTSNFPNLPNASLILPEHDLCIYSTITATNFTGVVNMSMSLIDIVLDCIMGVSYSQNNYKFELYNL